MNDPLSIVNPALRSWLTKEFIAAVYHTPNQYRDRGNICFSVDPGSAAVNIYWSGRAPCVSEHRVVVDPTEPWPPQPVVFEYGDRVTCDGKRALVVDVKPTADGRIGIDVEETSLLYRRPSELTPGWEDQ